MYRNEINAAAAYQLSLDYACDMSDFTGSVNKAVASRLVEGRREIRDTPYFFTMATMGSAAVASVDKHIFQFTEQLIKKYSGAQLFTGEVQYLINRELSQYNKVIGGVNIYYLPDLPYDVKPSNAFKMRVYEHDDIVNYLYLCKGFGNALLYDDSRFRHDKIAVCGINAESIIAMAGASSDSEHFWQIGIDVLEGYRGMGLGSALVTQLTHEVLASGAVPYYGTWSGNIVSQNVARKCGYYPAWAEMYAIDIE